MPKSRSATPEVDIGIEGEVNEGDYQGRYIASKKCYGRIQGVWTMACSK